jgi:hypothetical protein
VAALAALARILHLHAVIEDNSNEIDVEINDNYEGENS